MKMRYNVITGVEYLFGDDEMILKTEKSQHITPSKVRELYMREHLKPAKFLGRKNHTKSK